MAAVTITVQSLTKYNDFATDATTANMFTAVDASDGALVDYSGKDNKLLLVIQNVNASSAAKKVTIKVGNGIQGVNDIEKEIAAGKYTYIVIESGQFKNVSGTNKGKVLIKGANADIKVCAFLLP